MRDLILCVLGGGRSSRFGSSKLWVRVAGRPVVSHLRERLLGAAGGQAAACWLNLPPGAALPPGAGGFDRILRDDRPYAGPLAGMASVLAAVPRRSIIVFAAADMPWVDVTHVARLIDALRRNRRIIGAMSRWSGGPNAGVVEPLPSAWRVRAALAMNRQALAAGLRGPSQLAARRQVVCLPLGHPRDLISMMNINARADMAEIAQRTGIDLVVP